MNKFPHFESSLIGQMEYNKYFRVYGYTFYQKGQNAGIFCLSWLFSICLFFRLFHCIQLQSISFFCFALIIQMLISSQVAYNCYRSRYGLLLTPKMLIRVHTNMFVVLFTSAHTRTPLSLFNASMQSKAPVFSWEPFSILQKIFILIQMLIWNKNLTDPCLSLWFENQTVPMRDETALWVLGHLLYHLCLRVSPQCPTVFHWVWHNKQKPQQAAGAWLNLISNESNYDSLPDRVLFSERLYFSPFPSYEDCHGHTRFFARPWFMKQKKFSLAQRKAEIAGFVK